MNSVEPRPFRVVQCVELPAPADAVWETVGGFYTIHLWHPDITYTAVPANQTELMPLRRELTFPGQPITVEELVEWNSADRTYRYKWHAGEWGERIQQYRAEISVIEIEAEKRSFVRWASSFVYTEDAVSEFYWNGFRELQRMFAD